MMDSVLELVSEAVLNTKIGYRPSVCLTWAQSLDGRLTISPGTQTTISDSQSMQMTHGLRALHESILVGVDTVISDNPRLTCRMDDHTRNVVDRTHASFINDSGGVRPFSYDPIPIILDSNLRTPSESRCLQIRPGVPFVRPLLFYQPEPNLGPKNNQLGQFAQLIPVPPVHSQQTSSPHLDLKAVLTEVKDRSIKNIMVEGGASVISSFLDSTLWDIVIVTISGQLFRSGVALSSHGTKGLTSLTKFQTSKWVQVGSDMVFIGFPEQGK